MKLYGLIGFPLGHSFSEKYFADKFQNESIEDASYRNFPIESIGQVMDMIKDNEDLCGFNVTIPYKQEIIPFLTAIDSEAGQIGAVNCVKIKRASDKTELTGYNTDAYGFRKSLLGLIGNARPDALVLGTGGASKAVKYVLSGLGIKYISVSRKASAESMSYGQLARDVVDSHKLIVNCTPLGTYPKVEGCPDLPYEFIGGGHYLFDLVYNPPVTEFLRRGAANGAKAVNGYEMLVGQAEKAWEIWNK